MLHVFDDFLISVGIHFDGKVKSEQIMYADFRSEVGLCPSY